MRTTCKHCGGRLISIDDSWGRFSDNALGVLCIVGGVLGTALIPGPGRASVIMGGHAAKTCFANAKMRPMIIKCEKCGHRHEA